MNKIDAREIHTSASSLCPVVEKAFTQLGKKWVGLILHTLSMGELHFSELERKLPSLSARMLSQRMKELEINNLIERKVHKSSPVRVAYRLSEKGQSLVPVFNALVQWAEYWGKKEV